MVTATTVEVVAGRITNNKIRHFVVNIDQEISGMHNPKERNIKLALEAFANYRGNYMKGMIFIPFYKGARLPRNFVIPTTAGDKLMKQATADGEAYRVKDIEIYEKTKPGLFFVPSATNLSADKVTFKQAMKDTRAMLAEHEMEALRIMRHSKDVWDW